MNEQVINELLEQLRQNLKKIESAREQVEKTINAYETLKEDVRHYTEELSFIVQNTRIMISQLEEMKERFLGNISTKIVDEIHLAVTTITTGIDGISSQISFLSDFTNTKSEQINDNVNRRADIVDSTLNTIRTELSAIDIKVASCSNQLGQLSTLVNSVKSDEKAHYESIIKQMEEQENRLNTEFDVVRKQNKIFSITIIVLLAIIIGILIFMKQI